ncbi:MAG: hypothetical protein ACOYOB_19985, partial [Myxococcota bacterium]
MRAEDLRNISPNDAARQVLAGIEFMSFLKTAAPLPRLGQEPVRKAVAAAGVTMPKALPDGVKQIRGTRSKPALPPAPLTAKGTPNPNFAKHA